MKLSKKMYQIEPSDLAKVSRLAKDYIAFGAEYATWVRFSTASSLEELVTAAKALQKKYGVNIET